jgi:phosphoesterase RecJ-like protein
MSTSHRTEQDLDAAASAIAGASQLALACHVAPDGDALGSMLGLLHLCRAQGKPAVAGWGEPFTVGPHYEFLPGLELCAKPVDFPEQPEVMVTFDCGAVSRLGSLVPSALAARQLVVLDHHVTNQRFGTCNVVDPEAAATAVVVRHLAQRLGWPLNREAAMCLYTGLVTDTGRFQHSNTTPAVFALAEELAGFGLPISAMTRQLFEQHRCAYLQLAGLALSRMRLDPDLSLVSAWVSRLEMAEAGVDVDEVEGLIDLVRRTAEADVACVAKEAPDGVRVSLRSVSRMDADGDDSGFDVSAVAARFGGGGHRYAAGFTADGPVAAVLAAVRAAVADVRAGG